MRIGLIGTAFRRDNPTAIPPELQDVLVAATEIRIYPPRLSMFPNNPLDLAIQEMGYLDAGITAAGDGCDAVVINSVGDYGLAALKSATRKVAVGAGEAGLRVAAGIGRPFAVVTIWPATTAFLYRKLLRETGLEDACSAVLHVGTDEEQAGLGEEQDYIARMQGGDSDVLGRVIRACRDAVADGAAAILLGCTCMSPVAAKIQAAMDVPVINPLVTAVKYAEMQVTLGLRQSSANFAAAHPARRDVISAMVAAGAQLAGTESCDYCIVAEDDAA
jgi:allantoin racemase